MHPLFDLNGNNFSLDGLCLVRNKLLLHIIDIYPVIQIDFDEAEP